MILSYNPNVVYMHNTILYFVKKYIYLYSAHILTKAISYEVKRQSIYIGYSISKYFQIDAGYFSC